MRKLLCYFFLFLFNALFLYSYPQKLVEKPDFTNKPQLQWEFKTDQSIYASPIIREGCVYVGGKDSILHVLDLITGIEKWNFHSGGEIRSNVCFGADYIYLNGGDGNIYALNISSGKLLWTFKTRGESRYDFADYFHSTPVYVNDVLYFGSGDSNFYAIDAGKGTLIWSYKTGGIVHTTPAIDHGKVFFGSFDGHVYALNSATGQLIWKFKTVGHRYFPKGEVQGSPTTFNKLVFIGARDYNVYAIDQNTGFCHWNKAFTRGWGLNNSISDSILYIGSADERRLISADPSTGEEFWNLPMEFLIFGNNAYSDSMLYVGTTIGKLHGISLKNGHKVWSFETDSYRTKRLNYFKEDDSYRDDIYSIIRSNEQFLEVECELGGIFSTPVIIGDLIVFTSTNGKIYCLKRK
jgi:eukaryotic-like serine/threonine-protein kinase